jgi:RNA polymerase sigma-70 factor (ECF subfamily)
MSTPSDLPPDLGEVYERHWRHVWHTLERLGIPRRDLEDAVHDVFVVVHRRLHTFDPSRSMKAWLTGIAWRVAADERRRARFTREVLAEPPVAPSDPAPGPEAMNQRRQRHERLLEALAALDLDHRVVFILHELDEVACPEIAEVVGVPLNTVYSRLRVARGRFREAVERLARERGEA